MSLVTETVVRMCRKCYFETTNGNLKHCPNCHLDSLDPIDQYNPEELEKLRLIARDRAYAGFAKHYEKRAGHYHGGNDGD